MSRLQRTLLAFGLTLGLGYGHSLSGLAADPACPNSERDAAERRSGLALEQSVTAETPMEIQADRVDMVLEQTLHFRGNVKLQRGGQIIRADDLHYNKIDNSLSAGGQVRFNTELGDSFITESLFLHLDNKSGYTDIGEFYLAQEGRGQAQTIRFLDGNRLLLKDVDYTTCPRGNDDWYLKVGQLRLDREQEVGKANNATVYFKRIPLFYWPYLEFPLTDKRKTGLLAPEIGYSDQSGGSIATPFYWNIAPNLDDTLIPRWYSKRGLQLYNEFRYLGQQTHGIIEAEGLYDDRVYKDNRAAAKMRHDQRLGSQWKAVADLKWVSDKDYLEDFSDSLSLASQTHLPETVSLAYQGRLLQLSARAFGFQTVDDDVLTIDKPYELLPQIMLSTALPARRNRLNTGLEAEWTRFDRSDSLVADRSLVDAHISLPLQNSYAFLIPEIGGRYLAYDQSDTPEALRTPGFDERLSQSFGYYSLDAGVIWERDLRWIDHALTQTLEPRLYYLYSPERAQNDLPLFDTNEPGLSLSQLFRSNRFVGGDRFGDADQLSYSLSTRFLDSGTGRERGYAGIGQIYYFEQPQVALDPAFSSKLNSSDIIVESAWWLANNWYTRINLQWDRSLDVTEKASVFVQYHPQKDSILNLGYYSLNNQEKQADLSLQWPLGSRWTAIGRWHYSLEHSTNLESIAGLEYRSCCWALQLAGKRRLASDGDQIDSFMLQLELTGLGNIGDATHSPLKESLFFDSP